MGGDEHYVQCLEAEQHVRKGGARWTLCSVVRAAQHVREGDNEHYVQRSDPEHHVREGDDEQ